MLSRIEEIVLLAVCDLDKGAYGVPIRERVEQLTGKKLSIGAVYVPLDRMATRGFLSSFESEPTDERGGRRKRFYRITRKGLGALREVQGLNERLQSLLPATARPGKA